MNTSCVFCDIISGARSAQVIRRWSNVLAFVPLDPVTDGHVLIVPDAHVNDASESPAWAAETMRAAADYAYSVGPCNIITSVGVEATQTVFHLHVHVVPRRTGDGLHLPWTGQERSECAS